MKYEALNLLDLLKEKKLLITSHRIYMRSSNGDVVEKVLPNVPIYDQFPVAVNQKQFSYINHNVS